ncbi:protein SPIRAL1-like 5 [Bidens hawaiensis]|uniref:protein SPIRAL1-like 5 n=1 Tax=Bidens hawaiensis TaxID=980011 RepID=UPI00404B0364
MMNKRSSSGGGPSSLGYLFGSDQDTLGQQQSDLPKDQSSPVYKLPYCTDNNEEKSREKAPTPPKKDDPSSVKNYIYHGDGDKSTGFLVSGRPSTRVKSVPGGDSSLGYLFGDK